MEYISELIQTSKDIFTTKEVAYYSGITEEDVRYYTKVFEPILPIRKVSQKMRIYTKQDIYKLVEMITYADSQRLSAKETMEHFLANPIMESMKPQKNEEIEKVEEQLKKLIEIVENIQGEYTAATKQQIISKKNDIGRNSLQRMLHL